MTINANDIKLLESEIMADTTDGGGRRTSRVIPDGVAGNIFPKVSRLDAVYGRVNLRKVFGAVQTADIDTYAGSHAVITDPPDNDKIHTTLFSTGSEFDSRTAARDRIESYVTSSSESRMTLIGRQLPGQQSILCYQRIEEPLPEIGAVFCLSSEAGSTVSAQQYIRVSDIAHEVRTFTDQAEFQRRVITMNIGQPLRYEFTGPDTPSRISNVERPSRLRETTVVDAARYYGIKKFAQAATAGSRDLMLQSVYTPVVPTTNRETAIANEHIGDSLNLVASAASYLSETLTGSGWANDVSKYTQRGIVPGTLTISGSGIASVTDNRLGSISDATFAATVDYENGIITRTGGGTSASTYTATYLPGVSISQPSHTKEVPVKINNRGTAYAIPLNTLPSAGSVIVDYRAQGKWYRLRDNGDGTLSGSDRAYGLGNIDYATGSLSVTLGALPDVGSSVLVSFGATVHYAVRAGASSDMSTSIKQTVTLPDLPVAPDTVSITYTSGGATHTATDNSTGVLSGGGITGTVDYTTGTVNISYVLSMPDPGTSVSVLYQQELPVEPSEPVGLSVTGPLTEVVALGGPIKAGTLNAVVPFSVDGKPCGSLLLVDSGGGFLMVLAATVFGAQEGRVRVTPPAATQAVAAINYATGVVTFTSQVETTLVRPFISSSVTVGSKDWRNPIYWDVVVVNAAPLLAAPASFAWKTNALTSLSVVKSVNKTLVDAPLTLFAISTVGDSLVPNSLLFTMGGHAFVDRNGTLYADSPANSGVGSVAGSVDYKSGVVTLSSWLNGATINPSVLACTTKYGDAPTAALQFRTPGSPIRPGSLYIQATTEDGVQLTASSNESGIIIGTNVTGTVNQETGTVSVDFGQMVTAAGNELEDWYRAGDVEGGQIFKPARIYPDTFTFSCVALTNLPLNADILGLDPVRLPMDGRVPIFRPSDVAVIHHTGLTALTNPVVASSTYNVGRANLSEIWLVDTAGVKVPANKYSFDLSAGTVTIAADFNAGTLVQPLIAKHRIEDMSLVTDVQINGQVTITEPGLSRDYPIDSYVSSALLFGDMNARATNVHDLLAFTAWSDTPATGSNAQYNNLDYPIEVLNNGAVTERWRINFTSTTVFQVVGENLGVIATGTTAGDCSPANQLTGQPYFVLRASGWGAGWAAGNQLRFNTVSAAAPIWIARTVLPGATLEGDSFSMQMRGDVDA